MSNWPFQIAGTYSESVAFATTGNVPLTSFTWGSATTYSAWQSMGGSFTRPMDGIFVFGCTSDTDAQRSMICLSTTNSDAGIFVKDLWFPAGYYHDALIHWLPVRVPAGQTIYLKLLTPGVGNKRFGLLGLGGNYPTPVGFAGAEGIGMDTTNCWPFSFTPVASGITWNQVVASTSKRYGAVSLRDNYGADNIHDGQGRFGIGSAANEQVLLRWFTAKNSSYPNGAMDAIPMDIPSGSRLSLAAYCSGTLGTRRTALLGFY